MRDSLESSTFMGCIKKNMQVGAGDL